MTGTPRLGGIRSIKKELINLAGVEIRGVSPLWRWQKEERWTSWIFPRATDVRNSYEIKVLPMLRLLPRNVGTVVGKFMAVENSLRSR